MNPTIYSFLIFLHVCAAAFWVGGMATMHFAVRPAAVALLQPPQRLPFMAAACLSPCCCCGSAAWAC